MTQATLDTKTPAIFKNQAPLKTALYPKHVSAGAKMVDFYGWSMPLHYGSQTQEHHCVRGSVGFFDVSHMMVTDIYGVDREAFLKHLLANDVAKLGEVGKALYSLMLNETGGIIDDLIVYRFQDCFRLVTNAGTRDRVKQWLQDQAANFDLVLKIDQPISLLAVQGPEALKALCSVYPKAAESLAMLKRFSSCFVDSVLIARTGYTGEDGFEVMLEHQAASNLWDTLSNQGLQPCGLGARDTLRLEAGLNLYGMDMDETCSPFESNLDWTLSITEERNFIGKTALLSAPKARVLVALSMGKGPVPRAGSLVNDMSGNEIEHAVVTSGGFSPSLQGAIALARVPQPAADHYQVRVRQRSREAASVTLPFVAASPRRYP